MLVYSVESFTSNVSFSCLKTEVAYQDETEQLTRLVTASFT